MTLLDTHAVVKQLIHHGFPEGQAEILVEIMNDQRNKLVTKKDLEITKKDLQKDLEIVKKDLQLAIKKSNIDLLKWMIPFFLTVIVLIITALFIK